MSDERREDPADRAAGARLTPYEIVFAEIEETEFPRIEREAEGLGIDPAQKERFAFLSVASDLLREMIPEEAPPEVLEQHRELLFHAYGSWRYGRPVYSIDRALARYLVEAAPSLSGWRLALPRPSIYLQLPANLFWASVTPESTPEPVDGFFVTAAAADDPLGPVYTQVDVLMALGVRQDRPGFSVVPFETISGSGISEGWELPARDGREFENVLPGGEMAGLYSIVTVPEALKLVGRCLWYIDRHPGDVTAEDAPGQRPPDRPGAVPRSRLPFHRVSLSGN